MATDRELTEAEWTHEQKEQVVSEAAPVEATVYETPAQV